MVPVELGALVTTGAENLRALAAERGVGLKLEGLGDGPIMVRGTAEKLVQLVDNLLVNAVKYNRENGDVRVSVSRRDDKVSLKVADSGVGMDRDQMAKIFNRFYRGAVSGMDQLEGLGIGLSLVQEIVRLHGGDIQVQSEPGVGTTFTVTLEACP
jgi:signal transduction histidine kinase